MQIEALRIAAATAGHPEALFHPALISLGGIARSFDAARCASDLHAAAVGAQAPAQRALGLAWAHLGDEDAGMAVVRGRKWLVTLSLRERALRAG